ncbi:hypothetical protein VTI74DRAFT_4038 [Chaetomium olivicolor]
MHGLDPTHSLCRMTSTTGFAWIRGTLAEKVPRWPGSRRPIATNKNNFIEPQFWPLNFVIFPASPSKARFLPVRGGYFRSRCGDCLNPQI